MSSDPFAMPGVRLEAKGPKTSGLLSGRLMLVSGAVVIAALALLPIAGLLREGLIGLTRGNASLGPDGLAQVRGTVTLLLGTAGLGGLVGTANGWLLANCRFQGRRWLRIAQLLPWRHPPICSLPHW